MRTYYGRTSGTLKSPDGNTRKTVIWGDWLDVEEEQPASDHFKVKWKAWDPVAKKVGILPLRVKKSDCRDTPLLEMIFLDVGQGDSCILSVPDGSRERTLIIDAGQYSNLHNFLQWRFRYVDSNARFHAAVITHSDQDHYRGFVPLIKDQQIFFERVYHNGLVERDAADDLDILGPRADGLCTDIREDRDSLEDLVSKPASRGNPQSPKVYPTMMWAMVQDQARFADIRMASTEHGEKKDGRTYLPGFAPAQGKPAIEIVGPVPERTAGGKLALRQFGERPRDGKFDVGKTKNGHSIILRLEYGGFSAVFGGDLNRPSEDYLLRHYGEIADTKPLKDALTKAKTRLSADLLKCCHHGSADVTDEFVEAVNPFAFVVSSGDEESHVHPRPDILGLLGQKGRSGRPLILCTEILRSTPSSLTLKDDEKTALDKLLTAYDTAATDADKKKARSDAFAYIDRRTRRLVTQYGAITMRTDGQRVLIAFRKEATKKNQSPWQLFEFRLTATGWAPVEAGGGH